VVKPHLVLDGAAGLVLDSVLDHFEITAAELFMLDKVAAAEFYEVRACSCDSKLLVLSPGRKLCPQR
jgi:hypothetical protein